MNIGYVEHPHHQKTKSTQFFIERLIAAGNQITRHSRDDFTLDMARNYDALILFQADECIPIATKSKKKTLVIPMLDESLYQKSEFFRESKNLVYLAFSKTLHDFLTASGVDSTFIQYWPKPNFQKRDYSNKLTVFFWERTPAHVRTYNVVNWFRKYDAKFVIRRHWDPNHSQSGLEGFPLTSHIEFIDSEWMTHSEYLDQLSRAHIFVAPRRWEGIGMSSLDALTRGIPVVGLNSPTLNEYVTHLHTGVLIDEKFKPLEFMDFGKMSKNLEAILVSNYEKCNQDLDTVIKRFSEKDTLTKKYKAFIPRELTLREYVYLTQ